MALKDRITTLMDYARKAMLAATASSAAIGGGAVAYKAVTTDPVVLEAVAVPSSLEEQGYSPEIATQRILDELASLNRATVSAKDRTSFGDKRLDLADLDAGIAGLDLKQAIGILRELFGKTVHRISGEITQRKEGETTVYRVRLRQTPERTRLVEFEAKGDPDHLFRQVALKLLESVDPHVAAAVYWNRLHDRDNALRLIDVVLNNDTPADDKYLSHPCAPASPSPGLGGRYGTRGFRSVHGKMAGGRIRDPAASRLVCSPRLVPDETAMPCKAELEECRYQPTH